MDKGIFVARLVAFAVAVGFGVLAIVRDSGWAGFAQGFFAGMWLIILVNDYRRAP